MTVGKGLFLFFYKYIFVFFSRTIRVVPTRFRGAIPGNADRARGRVQRSSFVGVSKGVQCAPDDVRPRSGGKNTCV